MRHRYVISLVLVVIFISPMLSSNDPFLSNDNNYSGIPESMTNYVNSADPYSGTGPSLPVSLSGIATDRLGGSLQIDSSTSDIHTITLDDGWTGSNLQTTIDSLSVDISDVLTNPSLDLYHPEKWFVGSTSYYSDNVYVPDGWIIVKDVVDYDSLHPQHGMYELDSDSNGKDSTRGLYVEAQLTASYDADPNDEMYISQMVSMPYRELFSAQVTFDYRVSSSSNMDDKVHLFIRLAGSTTKFNIFESGDTTDTWLSASVTIQASSMTDLATKVMLFDIGIATDESGVLGVTSNAYAYLDNVQVDIVVRPFPEQIDLKVNGTAVVGSISDSIYQYEPDNDTRDAWDDIGNGLDLSGNSYDSLSADADLGIHVWSSVLNDWPNVDTYQTGIQFPVDIPQGAIITSAYLEVEPIETTGSPSMRIYASGFDSGGLAIGGFTSGLPQLEDRLTWVETSIDWDPGTWDSVVRIRHRSPEIAPLIQSIISEANWASGNHVCIMLDYLWSTNSQDYNSFKGAFGSVYSEDEFPRLFVEYMIPLPEDTVYFMQYEKDITVDHSQVSAILNDFPVLIDIMDTDLKTDVQADGDDIVFMIGDQVLDFEIEYFDQGYNSTHAHLVAWVKVPILYATRSTVITMAYGNPNAGSSSTTSVWDDFETVHHLTDDPTGTIYDSTANNYDGTSYGTMTSGDLVTGIAGNAMSFDGTDDVISIGQIDTDEWTQFTMSIWFYRDIADDERVFSKSSTTSPQDHIITLRVDGGNVVNPRMKTDGLGGEGTDYKGNISATTGSWHYVSWSWSASRGTIIAYLDGAPIIQSSQGGTSVLDENSVFVIGNNDLTNARFWTGLVDEARLTTSIRTEAWIDTEYNNQVNPSSFVSVGAERTIQSSWADTESTSVQFSTSSITAVDIFPIVTMDIIGGGQTLDENMQEGTSFYVANDTVVEWTANVLVSPPADTDSLNVIVDYPLTEWKPLTVTNPIGQAKTYGTDWTYHDGSIVIYSDAVDIWGVWTIEFESWNYVYDMKLGPNGDSSYDTYTFNIGETAEFKVSSPWIENARTGLVLTDPTGSVWHTNFTTTGVPGTWDVPSFSYRMQLTVPAAQVDADVTNFPMLVSFTDTDFITDVQADGDDFVFIQNSEVLAHEIDRFDQSTGQLVAWVRANLSSTVDNTFWLYYGNPVIGSTESPETLWSNGYEAVWLLNEDVTDESSGGLHIDSTSNGYIGTQDGNSRTSGIDNGYGQSFDGNDWITINSTESLQPTGDVTISGWFYISSPWTSTSTPSRLIMSKYLDGNTNFHIALVGSEYTEGTVAAGSLVFGFENDNGEYVKWTNRTDWGSDWYHFACVMDADTPSNNKIYINGADNTNTSSEGSASSLSLAYDADWGIGGRYVETSEFPTGEAFHTGLIDEIRISTGQRTANWIGVEYDNVNSGTFITRGTEQTRTSPEHTIDKVIDSSSDAGLWTASFYYNDTGATVSYKTGLYERNFIVKHDSSLSLINPTDAVGDKTAYKVAGEILYIEVELTDDINADKITGAAVTMNWSVSGVPTELTLNDIGNGRYGKSVDTADLGDAGQYRININSYHQFYNNATDYFDLELYHATELDFTDVDSTPVGFDFTATLIFNDTYDGTPITGATITFENGTAVNVVAEGAGRYNISLSTSGLSLGDHVFVFKATKAGAYLEEGSVTVTFTLRKHFTLVSVTGDFVTPFGDTTSLTIVITDTDTGATLSSSDVSSFLLDPASYSNHPESNPTDLLVDLDTSTWLVGSDTITLSVIMSGNYYNPSNYLFDIQIRNHYTSVAVIGDLISPYGMTTSLTIVITDTDTGATLSSSDVASFLLDPASYSNHPESNPTDLLVDLDTTSWSVGTDTVTLSVVMTGNYDNPSNYLFDIQIRNHYTSVTILGDLTTPYGQTTGLTLVITDTDTGLTLTSSSVTSFTFTPSSYGSQSDPSPSDLDFLLVTSGWSVATETVTLSVIMSGNYNNPANYDFDIIIRNHFTSLTVIGDLSTPYGETTALTIIITDIDTGATLSSSDVSSFLLDPASYGNTQETSPTDLDVILDTTSWSVGTDTVTLSVVMTGNYDNPSNYLFDIQIRNHHTSVTVLGDLTTPYGQTTALTIVITDTDTGLTLTSSAVTSFTFTPSSYGSQSDPSPADLDFLLVTSVWSVATETVTLSVVMSGNYNNPANYDFDITIRNHFTSLTVSGDLSTPYGDTTLLTIVITDTDTGATLSSSDVTSFLLDPATVSYSNYPEASPTDLVVDLDTSSWSVATESVTLSVVMTGNYDNPTNYVFDIVIRNHYTSITVSGNLVTPYGDTTLLTIVITDTDTGATLSSSDVSSFLLDPASYSDHSESNPSDLIVDLATSSWSVATETVTLSVIMTGNYDNPSNYVFDIQIRNHYTSITVTGNLVTAYGETTSLTIIITDTDTGATLSSSDVASFLLDPASYGNTQETSPTDLDVILDTSSWSVATETVTLSLVMTGNYDNPSNYVFNIQIRDRLTSITVIGNLETPFGNVTQLTIVITDLDSGTTLIASDVSSFSFSSSYGTPGETNPSDLLYDLDTSSWDVDGETVTLSVVMTDNYQNPANYVFTITIRSMTTSIINEPNDLRYPTGADFKIVVMVNVSEQGSSFSNPVTGILQGEFAIRNSTHTIPIKEFYELGSGRYNITINESYFPEGIYIIYITVTPTNNHYAESQMTLIFEYTPARSELSSPDRAALTPYELDFVVTLTFWDIDRDQGINGATITALGITIYNQQNLENGDYQVTVDVSGLAKGEHLYNLTADKSGYEAQTISFKVVIRIAYTYAIPTVGALDIPVGDDPVFYVEYWDIDHDLAITDGAPFLATSTWIHSVTITYIPLEERYRVIFTTNNDDTLVQNFIVSFNFSKGENYQFGLFNISITIRTHNTDFRLVSAVEPVSYTDNITISVFYGDIDSGEGIASQYVTHRVWNGTVNVLSYLYNVSGQSGYYTIIVPAQQFGGLGLQNFTVYFNWTGPVSTYQDSYLVTAANIVGEDSRLTLILTAEPTPYLENMTYTLFYSAVNGTGISNITNNVYVSVEFVGETIDLSQVEIWEINQIANPGNYSIRFNTSLFAKTGLIYMKVYINWAKGVEPFYSNRTDTISVRILPRDTLVSIDHPIQTPYSVNATFSFTYDDVTGALNEPIAEDVKLTVTTSLSDYSITYDDPSRTFTISFDTVQFGALGIQTFTLDVTWDGSPFYANQTGRSISVTVIARQTVLDYQTPSPTQYVDNVTFSVTWTDVVEATTGIEGATITLYDDTIPISSAYYTVYEIGSGVYSVVLNTTYMANPGTYGIIVNITSTDFYYTSREDTRSLTIRYRSTITSSEPINTVPYSSSFTVILYYQDIITLDVIGNDSSQVTFDILNGSSWIYTIEWKQSLGYYELTVQTSNQPSLGVGSVYSLHINMSFAISSPFYKPDDAYITFEIRSRASSLERQLAPIPTPYLDNITFTVYFSDADDLSPITSANVYVLKGATPLNLGTEYFFEHLGGGVYEVIIRSDALDGLGVTAITVQANWTGGPPFHDDAEIGINLTVTERSTNVEIVTPPVQTNYLENVTFVISFIDLGTGLEIPATKDLVEIYNGAVLLTPAQFSMTQISAYTYEISINSTILSAELVTNRIITVHIDWPDSPVYHKDDSTSTSATTIARSTYVSVDRPGNTAYGENATFTFSFVDSTILPEVLVAFSGEMSIAFNLTDTPSLSYDVASRLFTVSVNTSQFGDVGLAVFYINVTWAGSPYYSNKTLQLVYVTVTMRQTQVYFEAPAPTPYGDVVTFDVSYIDISGSTEVGISDGTLTIYYLGVPVPGANYILTPDGSGNFEIQFDTDFFSQPGYYDLNVSLVYTGGYFRSDAFAVRTLNVRYRTTILSANPVGQIGYETTLEITLFFQDILTLADIDDTFTTFEILNDTGTPWIYTLTWQPATSDYLLVITTVGQTTLTLGDHALWLNMSYAGVDPFYRWDDVYVEFTIRTRTSALDLQEAAIPAPFQENISFVVYYWDADVTQGITGATFIIEESGAGILTLNSEYFVVDGAAGIYTIYINSTVLGGLNTYSISVTAVWPGSEPYHNNAQRDVSVTTIQRTAIVDILEPANQARYLDNVVFTFAYIDSINGGQIGILSTDVTIFADGTLLTGGQYVLTPGSGSAFIVTINSTVLSATLVSDFNVTVYVTWDGSSPFYTNDGTSMKVSTTERLILVEPQQIETTPVHDWMNITFFLIDEDNDNPVSGAIIVFSCVSHTRTLDVGSEYTLDNSTPGVYIISINTDALVLIPGDLGDFFFELEVQWNQNNQPFYKNRTAITLTGAVDLIWMNLVSEAPTPSPVEITGNVTILITLTDLDHNLGIDLPIEVIEVHYYGTSIIPDPMTITYLGAGMYSIEFSTIDLNITGSYPVNISISYYPYTAMAVNPSLTVSVIATTLTPFETEKILNWTEQAYIRVNYNDLLNLNLTSGASLNWTFGTASGTFTEIGTTGVYFAYVNTSLADSGTGVVTIRADKDKYQLSVTTVTLIVLSLSSDLVIDSPEAVFEHARGDPIDVVVHLTDEYNGGITIQSGVTSVHMMFESIRYDLTYNGTDYTWYTTLPSSATADLEPGRIYSARIFAEATNYNPASSVFKMDLQATSTIIDLFGDTVPKMEVVYNEIVTFQLNFTETQTGVTIDNATILWIHSGFSINETFTYNVISGLWELHFNTSEMAFGTWGIAFYGTPGDPNLGEDIVDLTITVRKIVTEVISPIPGEKFWGWAGYVTFFYNDTYFGGGISNATATYQWGTFSGSAIDHGNGNYSIFINTTFLETGIRYPIIISFNKENYEVSSGGISLYIEEVPTEIDLFTPTDNQIDDIDELQLPFGDSILISFYYNDTDDSDGYVGGLSGATIAATIYGGGILPGTSIFFEVFDLGNGTYYFVFDSTSTELFDFYQNSPQSLPNSPFNLRIEVDLPYRETQTNLITITIVDRPTTLEIISDNVIDDSITMYYGETIEILLRFDESWIDVSGNGITDAMFNATPSNPETRVQVDAEATSEPGVYLLTIQVDAPLIMVGYGTVYEQITIVLSLDNYEQQKLELSVRIDLTDEQETMNTVISYATPSFLLLILAAVLWTRHFSIPKRLRQINSQIKALKKGKIPKPVEDSKSRQELVAELFNDTFQKLEITRQAIDMPDVAVPIKVPEIRELLIQLAILTHLNQDELDEFNADISKMKLSEQAAFVKEVINQEAIRAARAKGITIEEVLAEVAAEATGKISATDEIVETTVPDEPAEERVFLDKDELKAEEPETVIETPSDEEEVEIPTEKLSQFEIDELKADLIKKGVPIHEIDTIIEQARQLSRDLVEELIKSLGLKD